MYACKVQCLNAKKDMNVSIVRNVGGMEKRNAKTELKGPLSSIHFGDDKPSKLTLSSKGVARGNANSGSLGEGVEENL